MDTEQIAAGRMVTRPEDIRSMIEALEIGHMKQMQQAGLK